MFTPAFNKRTDVHKTLHLLSVTRLALASLAPAVKHRPCAKRYAPLIHFDNQKIYVLENVYSW